KKWLRNKDGGKYHYEAIDFLKDLNNEVKKYFPKAMMIAEESTAFPNITKPTSEAGLGFSYKWNMGWMNDTLSYMKFDPYFRSAHHHQITFSLMYAFSENYILPFSHDEVVHLKKSILGKMPGNLEQKFKNIRVLYGYQMTHPGKKLNFMGMEFGQLSEWDHNRELDWHLQKRKLHRQFQKFVSDMNKIYLKYDMLWELDHSWQGFTWLDVNDAYHNLLLFRRFNKKGGSLTVILNFSGSTWENYRIGVEPGRNLELINSDDLKYGGNGLKNQDLISEEIPYHGLFSSILLNIPALSIIILRKDLKDD
ncbi:MAG: alpha amylase C-terminal domain-containing protein, partial [Bacilli bacterium]|nr:alpha amylase C-terminal domain-containing protein [Bacilli bacterium]